MVRRRFILGAGPALTFCAASKQRVLHDTLAEVGDLCAPDVVHTEVLRKARSNQRFAAAERNWGRLIDAGRIELLDSDADDLVIEAVESLSGTPFEERMRASRDLGELMVMAHAVVLAKLGHEVVVMIDEIAGKQQATRLGLHVIDTEWVLARAVKTGRIDNKAKLRRIYAELRSYDDGLVDISQTRLLKGT